jgi:nitrogen fixation protein FixH
MHINWGIKITVLYVGFVILILIMVSMAMNQKVDLVSKNYYEQELKYQDKIDKTDRTRTLSEQLSWHVNGHALLLKFPKQFKGQDVKGTIYFFRPSDEAMDKTIQFLCVDTSLALNVNTEQLKRGVYKMEVNWEVNKEKYYNESILNFN